jgi:hypothetical protein
VRSSSGKKKRSYTVCTSDYVATNTPAAAAKKRGYMVCTSDYVATNTRRSRLQGLNASSSGENKRGYMVCTSDYVATNTRKTKEGCKKFSEKQAVSQRRPTPRKLQPRRNMRSKLRTRASTVLLLLLQPSACTAQLPPGAAPSTPAPAVALVSP